MSINFIDEKKGLKQRRQYSAHRGQKVETRTIMERKGSTLVVGDKKNTIELRSRAIVDANRTRGNQILSGLNYKTQKALEGHISLDNSRNMQSLKSSTGILQLSKQQAKRQNCSKLGSRKPSQANQTYLMGARTNSQQALSSTIPSRNTFQITRASALTALHTDSSILSNNGI